MTNMLDLVPSLDRQLKQYREEEHTDSTLAGYLADACEALNFRWSREYVVTSPAINTYIVSPDIDPKDKRPVILMASIIYLMGNWAQAYKRDGDFAIDPRTINAGINPIVLQTKELGDMLPSIKLASARTAALRGFNNIWNRESYDWAEVFNYL